MFKLSLNVISCSENELENLQPEIGQVVSVIDDNGAVNRVIVWTGTEWANVESNTNGEITMTEYEINQQLIHQLPTLTDDELEEKKQVILNFCNSTNNEYYMLLCRDVNYYTLCHRTKTPIDADNIRIYTDSNELITIQDLIIECSKIFGEIKSIEVVNDNSAIEIWVDNPIVDGNVRAMYFFPYDGGVEACQ